MIDPADISYLDVQTKRAQLAAAVDTLYGQIDSDYVRPVHNAFLKYEGAVLVVMQENLEAMETLIARVERAEALNRPKEAQDVTGSFSDHQGATSEKAEGFLTWANKNHKGEEPKTLEEFMTWVEQAEAEAVADARARSNRSNKDG